MDYKEKYEQALERAKVINPGTADYEVAVKIFPELKESEDEVMKGKLREILRLCYKVGNSSISTHDYETLLTWLEKQGEQKPTWSEEDERICTCLIKDQEKALNEVKKDKYGHSEIISDLKEMYRKRIDWLKSLKQRNL